MNLVDTTGIDRVRLLKALWEGTLRPKYYLLNISWDQPWDEVLAAEAVLGYIEYFQGRFIDYDLRENMINPMIYDLANGKGTFQGIVDKLRND